MKKKYIGKFEIMIISLKKSGATGLIPSLKAQNIFL